MDRSHDDQGSRGGRHAVVKTATDTKVIASTAEWTMSTSELHALAGKKFQRRRLASAPSLLEQEKRAAPPSLFAQLQLTKMGWQEGTGLGKRRHGITTHLQVEKRRDEQAGLGTESHPPGQHPAPSTGHDWWKESLATTLAKLSSSSKSDKGKKKSKGTDNNRLILTDQELFEATGGLRFGMRAAPTKSLHKWKRTNDDLNSRALHHNIESTTTNEEGNEGEKIGNHQNDRKRKKCSNPVCDDENSERELTVVRGEKKKRAKGEKKQRAKAKELNAESKTNHDNVDSHGDAEKSNDARSSGCRSEKKKRNERGKKAAFSRPMTLEVEEYEGTLPPNKKKKKARDLE